MHILCVGVLARSKDKSECQHLPQAVQNVSFPNSWSNYLKESNKEIGLGQSCSCFGVADGQLIACCCKRTGCGVGYQLTTQDPNSFGHLQLC